MSARVTARMVAAAQILEDELAPLPEFKLRAEILRLELEALLRAADLVRCAKIVCETVTLSRDEIVARLELGASQRLGVSAATMIADYRAGRLSDLGAVVDLLALAGLLAEDDPLYAGD